MDNDNEPNSTPKTPEKPLRKIDEQQEKPPRVREEHEKRGTFTEVPPKKET